MGEQQVGSLKDTLEQIRAEQRRLAQLEEHFQLVIGYYESAGDQSKVVVPELPDPRPPADSEKTPAPEARPESQTESKLRAHIEVKQETGATGKQSERGRTAISSLMSNSDAEGRQDTMRRASEILRNNEIRVRQQAYG